MAVLLKALYRFSAVLLRIPVIFSREVYLALPKFIWSHSPPPPQIAKAVLEKKMGGNLSPASNITTK